MNAPTQKTQIDVDAEALREQVKLKYSEVATDPNREFHFHTGRPLTVRLDYDQKIVSQLPDEAVESFAGVANPFSPRDLNPGDKIVDLGAGAGMDSFIAANLVGTNGEVVGVDMTPEMLTKSRQLAQAMNVENVEFRQGLLEDLPVEDSWADAAISNGVINLCADKQKVFAEIFRVLKPGGYLQFADIANSEPVPQGAVENIDLWTA